MDERQLAQDAIAFDLDTALMDTGGLTWSLGYVPSLPMTLTDN